MPPTNIIPPREYLADDPLGYSPDKPMTEVQAVKLRELADRTGEPFDGNLTQVQAQKRMSALEEMLED